MAPLIRLLVLSFTLSLLTPSVAFAESSDYLEEDPYSDPQGKKKEETRNPPPQQPAEGAKAQSSRTKPGNRKFFTDDSPRTDAGVFHVGFAFGGNFYFEPEYDQTTTPPVPNGNFYKDFGFQAGVYFDHDYSELDENIPLMLRGMVGYKYVLATTHVFSFDGMVRRMFRFSEKASFGVGVGASAAMWYRALTATSTEQIIFLPTVLIGAGFEFDPFMVDLKWSINRLGGDDTITGVELYFGFRL